MSLINTIDKDELKAILSHEMGHFSQKSMKLGSYVYNVNQIMFNMLFENQSYDKLIEKWDEMSGYFSPFVGIAVYINEVFQWVLKNIYNVVNKNYMSLSREMEFHADEIAAKVTSSESLKKTLLRMSLADTALNIVLDFYDRQIIKNLRSNNIYKEQFAVMNFIAEKNGYNIINNLPEITIKEQNKFNKSKLVIKDIWASHPSLEERIERLEQLNIKTKKTTKTTDNTTFKDIEKPQKILTDKIFESINYTEKPNILSFEEFKTEFTKEYLENQLPTLYNGYYDDKNPSYFEINEVFSTENTKSLSELFSDGKINLIYTAISLQNDINILKNISEGTYDIEIFDYDKKKYKKQESRELFLTLEKELQQINEKIKVNDIEIFKFFKKLEHNKPAKISNLYTQLFEFNETFDSKFQIYTQLLDELQFIKEVTPFEQIKNNLIKIKPIEEKLKINIKTLLSNEIFNSYISEDVKENFRLYLSENWAYFDENQYIDSNLILLYTAMNNYSSLLFKGSFLLKKNLLSYQKELIKL